MRGRNHSLRRTLENVRRFWCCRPRGDYPETLRGHQWRFPISRLITPLSLPIEVGNGKVLGGLPVQPLAIIVLTPTFNPSQETAAPRRGETPCSRCRGVVVERIRFAA